MRYISLSPSSLLLLIDMRVILQKNQKIKRELLSAKRRANKSNAEIKGKNEIKSFIPRFFAIIF